MGTGISKKPFTRALGIRVPGTTWRVSASHEGTRKKQLGYRELSRMLEQGLCVYEGLGVLAWNPRYTRDGEGKLRKWNGNPSTNIMTDIKPQRLENGISVTFWMKSEMDRSLGDKAEYSDTWRVEENSRNLRHPAGTGDFRIGLAQADGRWDPGKWHCYQARVFPYMHSDAKTHIGENDTSNSSHWYRDRQGGRGRLLDDYSQEGDLDGFKKLRHEGELKFGMGPHAPYGEWIKIRLQLHKRGDLVYPTLQVHNDVVGLDPYKHETNMADEFTHVDTLYVSFNNMRPYTGLKIKLDPHNATDA